MKFFNFKRYLSATLLIVILFVFCSCQKDELYDLKKISKDIGLDITQGEQQTYSDTHGGFLGDGMTVAIFSFPDQSLVDEIASCEGWKPLPLTKNLTSLVYGMKTDHYVSGPYFNDEQGKAIIPEIINGYYYFYDRQAETANKYSDDEVLSRHSMNLTFAAYDSDMNILYYIRFDT